MEMQIAGGKIGKERGLFSFQVSFLEISNEKIRDLLAVEKDLEYEIKMTNCKAKDLHVTNLIVEEVSVTLT